MIKVVIVMTTLLIIVNNKTPHVEVNKDILYNIMNDDKSNCDT